MTPWTSGPRLTFCAVACLLGLFYGSIWFSWPLLAGGMFFGATGLACYVTNGERT